jgi:hypothetical protein
MSADDLLVSTYLMSSYNKMVEYEDILCRFDERLRYLLKQRCTNPSLYRDLWELKMYLDSLIDESGIPNPLYKDAEYGEDERQDSLPGV